MESRDAALLLELSKADNLQVLIDLGSDLLGNPMFLDDMYRTVLAYSRNIDVQDSRWQTYVVENTREESLRARKHAKKVYVKSLEVGHPIYLDDDITVPRLVMTLTDHGRPIGNLTLASHVRPIGPGDLELFELVGSFACEVLKHSHYSVRQTQPIVINTLIMLLDGVPMTRNAIESKLADREWVLAHRSYLLVLSDEDGDVLGPDQRAMIEDLSALPFSIAFPYQGYILCLYSPQDPVEEWEEQAPELSGILTRYQLFAGVSSRFQDLMQLPLQYQSAVQAMKLGRRLFESSRRFLSYGDMAIFHLFSQISDRVKLLGYCDEKLLELAEYDRGHERNLLRTLQVYLETCLQLHVCAERLFVHKNTVRYRIRKCKEFLGSDFTDGEQLFRFTFSLKILEYYNYF